MRAVRRRKLLHSHGHWLGSLPFSSTYQLVQPVCQTVCARAARAERELATVTFERPPRPVEAPEPPAPRTFKVVDVMNARVLAEGADTRETLELLAGMRSALDARIYTWVPNVERWRLLTLGERRALWEMREMRGQGHRDQIPAREDGIAIVIQGDATSAK
jgi:hypothetical protein